MAEPRLILGVVLDSPSFVRSFKRIKDAHRAAQICATLRGLLLADIDQLPAKLHLHPLTGKKVASRLNSNEKVPAWSLHVTPDDRLKASFTYEEGVMYLRLVDDHDVIDKNP